METLETRATWAAKRRLELRIGPSGVDGLEVLRPEVSGWILIFVLLILLYWPSVFLPSLVLELLCTTAAQVGSGTRTWGCGVGRGGGVVGVSVFFCYDIGVVVVGLVSVGVGVVGLCVVGVGVVLDAVLTGCC